MKNIAIIGFGLEGRASAKYYYDQGDQITILDENENLDIPEQYGARLGEGVFDSDLSEYDLILRSPSIRPDKLISAQKVWSSTNEFFTKCPAKIIGVTGTKGKGTTASLIASILEVSGKKVHLLGNIGISALEKISDINKDDIVVYEMSNFQLWDIEKSPQIAVISMIEPDHLDVHSDFEEYVNAKSNIVKFQTEQDKVFYYNNENSEQIAKKSKGKKTKYGVKNEGVYIENNYFCVNGEQICSTDNLKLPGEHNLLNACGAINACLEFVDNYDDIAKGLSNFSGLNHRLKFVAEKNNIKYYDDSIATTEGSAIAALRAFSEDKVIILGGSDKGSDYDDVLKEVKNTNAKIISIGQTGEKIHQKAFEQGLESYRVEGLMNEVVEKATQIAKPNSVVILSPASASFGQYKNYKDRGEQFIKAVENL